MKKSITTESSFADMMILDSPKPSFLQKIDDIIDWNSIEKTIKKHYDKKESASKKPAYPGICMFKILLLHGGKPGGFIFWRPLY